MATHVVLEVRQHGTATKAGVKLSADSAVARTNV
jgi:hypothetical protein